MKSQLAQKASRVIELHLTLQHDNEQLKRNMEIMGGNEDDCSKQRTVEDLCKGPSATRHEKVGNW